MAKNRAPERAPEKEFEKHIVVIGSGGRELAFVLAFLRSMLFRSMNAVIDVLPGGGGFAHLARKGHPVRIHSDIKATNIADIVKFCIDVNAWFVFIGPEGPLDDALVDCLEEAGIRVFGPRKAVAIEGSKELQKILMALEGIPTADYKAFDNYDSAVAYLLVRGDKIGYVKADGECGGKGAEKFNTAAEGIAIVTRFMKEQCHGAAGLKVLIEEPLEGGNENEISLMILCDGTGKYVVMSMTQDAKPVKDNDEGLNGGGSGAWGPVVFAEKYMDQIKQTIIEPMLRAIASTGTQYKGCLYAGLIITPDGQLKVKVIEFNSRFGDPEGPVVLDLLDESVDVLALMLACAEGKLADFPPILVKSGFTVLVVLMAEGYPQKVTIGDEITGVEEAEGLHGVKVILSGVTIDEDGRIFTASGRAVCVLAHCQSLELAIEYANVAASTIEFRGKHCRGDIARKGLKALEAEGVAV